MLDIIGTVYSLCTLVIGNNKKEKYEEKEKEDLGNSNVFSSSSFSVFGASEARLENCPLAQIKVSLGDNNYIMQPVMTVNRVTVNCTYAEYTTTCIYTRTL